MGSQQRGKTPHEAPANEFQELSHHIRLILLLFQYVRSSPQQQYFQFYSKFLLEGKKVWSKNQNQNKSFLISDTDTHVLELQSEIFRSYDMLVWE